MELDCNYFHPVEKSQLDEMLNRSMKTEEDFENRIEELKEQGLLYQNDDGDWFVSIHF